MAAFISPILGFANTLIERLIPDKTAQAQAKAQLLSQETQGDINALLGQIEVNKTEAANNSKFVAGWRPFIGWVCGTGIAMDVIIRPLFNFVAASVGHPINLPALDMSTLIPLLGGMLGFGAMRSFDKTQGASNGH